MTISKIIVWLIIGALAGTLAGRLVTFSKQGLGFWTNLGLGEIKITFEDFDLRVRRLAALCHLANLETLAA
ncbi:MAG TPA: hypothetical protein VNY07_04155 [Chthoniobacterales bacterium]|jgi:hypothetical protein|nr:hypothetical protein [Chthoniobacterales bacterium]